MANWRRVTDPLGRTVRFGFDGSGNLTDVTDVAGGNTHFTYARSHLLLTMNIPTRHPVFPVPQERS